MRLTIWIALNALAVVAFLAVASQYWIEPELADVPGASGGDAIIWGIFTAPIAVLFAGANLGALFWGQPKRWITLLMLAIWIAAWLFDNAHHGI